MTLLFLCHHLVKDPTTDCLPQERVMNLLLFIELKRVARSEWRIEVPSKWLFFSQLSITISSRDSGCIGVLNSF